MPEPSEAPPCVACPWRDANRGKRHPDGWYTQANLARLWRGLRNGEPMSCHPTDPNNEVSPAAQAAGYRPAPPGTQLLECRGAIILQQRELWHLQETHDGDLKAYRAANPRGLTRDGVRALVARMVFGGTPFALKMARPDLNAAVGYSRLRPWRRPRAETDQ